MIKKITKMSRREEILENLFDILIKLNNLENPNRVTEILIKQSQLPELFIGFINSPYYNFERKINKKENILFILGYKLLSAIILSLVLYIKYKERIKDSLKEALKEGFKFSEAVKNEEVFLLGFISKIKKYLSQDDLEKILKRAHFSPSLVCIDNSNVIRLTHKLKKKDLENIEKYSQILMNLIEDYAKKLGV